MLILYHFMIILIRSLPTKMSPPPLPLQNHFLFSPRSPSALNLQAKSLIQSQKGIKQSENYNKKKENKTNSKTIAHTNKSKTIKKTIQNNPSNPTN